MYIMTRIARQMEDEGFDKVFAAAEAATQAIEVSGLNLLGINVYPRVSTRMKVFARPLLQQRWGRRQ